MFITLQFPLFDRRYLLADTNRVEKPNWPKPAQRERVRYFGEVLDRHKQYFGPYDDEKKYCNANAVFNLCGTGAEHFYKLLHEAPFNSRILFRRFQSDGKFLAKFEIGFNDDFEKKLDLANAANSKLSKLVFEHVKKYLLCPVKIRTGNKLTEFMPLIDACRSLANAYYWATNKGKRSFLPKDMQGMVEWCEPVILVQVDDERIQFNPAELQQIVMPQLAEEKIRLFHHLIPYKIGRYQYNLKAWIMSLPKNIYTNPINKREFNFYSNTVRYLRINLLRIHVEVVIQEKFLAVLSRQQTELLANDQQFIIRLYSYLHKLQLNLSGIMRNKQEQEALVNTAFSLNQIYAGSGGVDELLKSIEYYMVWLKTNNLTPQTRQVIDFLDNMIAGIEAKKEIETKEKTVFISYNHKDAITAQLLKRKLEANHITVILDSSAMKAGTSIEEFIGESIRAAQATIFIVSKESLLSGWVAMETVNMLNFETLFKGKRLIPCCLTDDFTKDNFVNDAAVQFAKRLTEIAALIKVHDENSIDSRDLNDEKSRINFLKNALDGIVGKLKKTLYLDIAGDNLENNFPRILQAI